MKAMLLSFLLLFVQQGMGPGPGTAHSTGGGGISFLAKGCSGSVGSGTALSCGSSITSVPSGATFLIWVSETNVGTVTVSDSGSFGSLAVISGYPCSYHGTSQGTVWIETTAGAGTHSFSATIPSGTGRIVVVAATGGTVDATPATKCATAFSSTATTNSLTTTQTNDLAFMLVSDSGGAVTWTFSGSPISLTAAGFNTPTADAGYGTIATVTTTNGVATPSSGTQWVAELVALH